MKAYLCLSLAVCALSASSIAASSATPAALAVATKGDEMSFDKVKLTAKPGQLVKLTFQNKASKASAMQHNWALVNPGTADTIGMAAMTVGPDKSYIPDSADIIAHTKLLNPGEKETVEFKAPQTPGEYPYICTFPGHYAIMKGVLQVK